MLSSYRRAVLRQSPRRLRCFQRLFEVRIRRCFPEPRRVGRAVVKAATANRRLTRIYCDHRDRPTTLADSDTSFRICHTLLSVFFYRATRMHSADYAVQDVCLSVCPSLSICHRYSVEMAKHIINVFFNVGYSPHHFPIPNEMAILRRGPRITGTSNERGGMKKNHDFRPISHFISEIMQDRAIVTICLHHVFLS